MNCPGLSVAHQRDVGIEMPGFWRGDDQCVFETCLCLTPSDKIFLTSALRKMLILLVIWLWSALWGAPFDVLSAEVFIGFIGELQYFWNKHNQDSSFHSKDKKIEITVVDSHGRKVTERYQAYLTPKIKVIRAALTHLGAEAWWLSAE